MIARPFLAEPDLIATPALLLFPDLIAANIDAMLRIAGGPDRLQPHIKTHKMAEVVRLQLGCGITHFKCATISEAEMTAACGASEVLLACQPVGPQIERLAALSTKFPKTLFATIADNEAVINRLSETCLANKRRVAVFLDLDVGMGRTGIKIGDEAQRLYQRMGEYPSLQRAGLHVYDGHIVIADLKERRQAFDQCMLEVDEFIGRLETSGYPVPSVVAGGSPTFAFHAGRPKVRCSPGTTVFWDAGYSHSFPDMPFVPAAFVATRVISKPTAHRICLDLGYKAISAEKDPPHAILFGLEEARHVIHNEEHLVLESERAVDFQVGDLLLGVPRHICPTVALYEEALVVEEGRVVNRWKVAARARRLTV